MARRDIVEIFGHSPTDLSADTRALWKEGKCPFINGPCIKFNHDKSIVYGTCSVTSPDGNVVICPNRFYADDYQPIRHVAIDAFDEGLPFFRLDQFDPDSHGIDGCVVALGKGSGGEVKVGSVSMDWILVYVREKRIIEFVGIEVQSMDTTGNYRDAWSAYKDYEEGTSRADIPSSEHGLNWANVHKRLVPQLIRKGVVYSRSKFAAKGMYFIVPDEVYDKFEAVVGELEQLEEPQPGTLSIHTYTLGPSPGESDIRELVLERELRVDMGEFAGRFIQGFGLPSGEDLDQAIQDTLGIEFINL